MEQINSAAQIQEQEEMFSIRDFMNQCLNYWQWFVLSVLIFCCVGILYILRQQPVYQREMAVLIQDKDNGGMSDITSAFSSMGLVASKTNVNNELISLTSPAVISEVVKRLGLEMNYTRKGTFHGTTLYGTAVPFKAQLQDLEEQQGAGFRMELLPGGKYRLFKFFKATVDGIKKMDGEVTGKIGFDAVNTPIGKVVISPNGSYIPPKKRNKNESNIYYIARSGMQSSIEKYSRMVSGTLMDKDAEVIELSMKDVSTQRAVDVLNTIVEVYNENWVEDKNKVAVATSKFIDERLAIIQEELGNVDSNISKYKSDNLIPDLAETAKLTMKEGADVSKSMLDLSNEMTMCVYLRDYVNNPANKNAVIPVNTGINSAGLETQIVYYNSLLLDRNTLVENSSVKNPLVADYDLQLAGTRESIIQGINAQVAALNKAMKNFNEAKGSVNRTLASGPNQAKYLLSVERQQKVMESLYLYLLQKREENELTQTFTAYNTRIITPPMGPIQPVAPKKMMIMGVAFLFGLLLPGAIIYIVSATNTTVRGRKDIERLQAPFAGEIPYKGKKSVFRNLRKRVRHDNKNEHGLEQALSVVREGSRDIVSESFRIVRGNLDFMNHNQEASNVMMVTSYNPGSGKSFVAYNLAASFALKGKSVLIVDGDLRHGSISQYVGMPNKGLSSYLTGNVDDWQKYVVKVADSDNMYIMPIGHRPPNPSELLDNERLGEFLNQARKEYDLVIIDCPPANVVIDAKVVSKWVDRTLFVIRAGLLDRQYISEIDGLYTGKLYPQMAVILNATETQGRKGYKNYGTYYSTDKD